MKMLDNVEEFEFDIDVAIHDVIQDETTYSIRKQLSSYLKYEVQFISWFPLSSRLSQILDQQK